MDVLVDTSVWSQVFRRAQRRPVATARVEQLLRDIITAGRAVLIGPVRQELLSGIRSRTTYDALREHLRHFPDPALQIEDYEMAAEHGSRCAAAGIQGSATDFLICAIALRQGWAVFSTDQDFRRYAEILPLKLYVTDDLP